MSILNWLFNRQTPQRAAAVQNAHRPAAMVDPYQHRVTTIRAQGLAQYPVTVLSTSKPVTSTVISEWNRLFNLPLVADRQKAFPVLPGNRFRATVFSRLLSAGYCTVFPERSASGAIIGLRLPVDNPRPDKEGLVIERIQNSHTVWERGSYSHIRLGEHESGVLALTASFSQAFVSASDRVARQNQSGGPKTIIQGADEQTRALLQGDALKEIGSRWKSEFAEGNAVLTSGAFETKQIVSDAGVPAELSNLYRDVTLLASGLPPLALGKDPLNRASAEIQGMMSLDLDRALTTLVDDALWTPVVQDIAYQFGMDWTTVYAKTDLSTHLGSRLALSFAAGIFTSLSDERLPSDEARAIAGLSR